MAPNAEEPPVAPIPPLVDDDVPTPQPPPSHTMNAQEMETEDGRTVTASTFAQLTRRPTEPASPDTSATVAGVVDTSKGKQRAELNTPLPPSPPSITEDLLSVTITENTSRANIPAIKQDVRTLATHMEKELHSYAAQQCALQATVVQLTEIVSTLRPTAPSTALPGPVRALQDRVERMAQHFERLDDQRGAELDDLRERAASLHDDTTVIIQGLGKLTALVNDLRSDIGTQKATTQVQPAPAALPPVLPPTPSTPSRGRSPSPYGGPSTPRQPRGRQQGYSEGRPHKRPRPLAPLSDPSPHAPMNHTTHTVQQPAPTSPVVRFGSITWSPQLDSLKREVRASARGAWDALPGVFENIVSFTLDERDQTYVLLRFVSPFLAQAFVDAWVQHKHKTSATQKARAEIVVVTSGRARALRVLSWNVHGNLALKMTDPTFVHLLCDYDVIMLQETHLRPDQDMQMHIPLQYSCLALARPQTRDFMHGGAGLLVIYRTDMALMDVTPAHQHEFIAVRICDTVLLSVYLPPPSSPWLANHSVTAEQRLRELVHHLVQVQGLQLIAIGDFNARVGTLTLGEPRCSPDSTVTSRGRHILQTGSTYGLQILNGTKYQQETTRDRYTSYQPGGSSVIDLAFVSTTLLRSDKLQLEVLPKLSWSDHAPLRLNWVVSDLVGTIPQAHRTRTPHPPKLPARPDLGPPNVRLEALLDVALQASERRTTETTVAAFYGENLLPDNAPLQVYVAVAQPTPASPVRMAMYWRPAHRLNGIFMIPNLKSLARAFLLITGQAVLVAEPTRLLRIWANSDYLHRVICHWAPTLAAKGWDCAHADVLQPLTDLLRARPAATRFLCPTLGDGDTVTGHAYEALRMARGDDTLAPVHNLLPLKQPAHWPTDGPPQSTARARPILPKVSTPIPPITRYAEPEIRDDGASSARPVLDELQAEAGTGQEPVPLTDRRREHLDQLVHAPTSAAFWSAHRRLTGVKPRHPQVTASQLKSVFVERMNPPPLLPPSFDPLQHTLNRLYAQTLPHRTLDTTAGQHFSRPFSVEEIDAVKAHLRKHNLHSAQGLDRVGYEDVLAIPTKHLQALFNACIEEGEAPQSWLTAIVAAVKKPKKDGSDPESYRTIGLESCLLKTMTVLIDRRLRAWADEAGRLPDTQSGFRAKHRTYNNAFVLRAAIEKARHLQRTLYVVYLDLANAFPSVDQDTLWTKLARWGAGGPIFDWLRMLYGHLRYVVRFDGEMTELFQALMGILIGDPASPMLWLLFISDFELDPHPHDVFLTGRRVSHLEQADDMALLCYSAAGMQSKLNQFERYCAATFVHINVTKSAASVHGPLPEHLPTLILCNAPLHFTPSATYVGMTFTSTERDIFRAHHEGKALKARTAAGAVMSLESYTGHLPPQLALTLYRAQVDPHLTAGCEIALAARPEAIAELEDVQHTFLRRALGISKRAQIAPLYTETGIWPLLYRRLQLALRYLIYVLRDNPPLVAAAFAELWELTTTHHAPSWWGDLHLAAQALPVPVKLPLYARPTVESLQACLMEIASSLAVHLHDRVRASQRLPVLQQRIAYNNPPRATPSLKSMCMLRQYLKLDRRRQRVAITMLLFSEHPLAIERLRRAPSSRPIPREWRICRLCKTASAIEDEAHALLLCPAPCLQRRRDTFLNEVFAKRPGLVRLQGRLSPLAFMDALLATEDTLAALADYTADVFEIYETTPILIVSSQQELQDMTTGVQRP